MGYAVATTVLSPATSRDLTDLATVKDELTISTTATDAWLARAITQVSRAVENHTQRVFAPELVQDAFDIGRDAYPYQTPGGFPALQLTRWPVLTVLSVTVTDSPTSPRTLTEGSDFRVDAATGALLRLNPWTGSASLWEASPVTVQYVAGYGAIVTETGTVPASTPWQVTPAQSAVLSCPVTITAAGATLTQVAGTPAHGQYRLASGIFTFAAADAGAALVMTYATRAMPEDLVEVALRLMTARYRARGRDPALVQRETPGVGMERWWFGGAPGQTGPFPPDIAGSLESYRVPVLA